MSAKATFWAWEQRLSSSEKLVLLCLGDCHNAETDRCDPSAKYIGGQTGLNIKTVKTAIEGLKEKGLISYELRPGKSPQFLLNLTLNWVYPLSGIPEIGDTQNREGGLPKIGQGVYPKSGNEPKKNLKPESKNSPPVIKANIDDTKIANAMYSEMMDRWNGFKANPVEWAEVIRKLREIDGYEHTEIINIWLWATRHSDFWKMNLRSPAKLRDRKDGATYYEIIKSQYQAAKLSTGQTGDFFTKHTDTSWADDLTEH